MFGLPLASLFLFAPGQPPPAEGAKPPIRPITEADTALAVYMEDWGLVATGEPTIILAIWPDGQAVWSGDRLRGGPPYSAGRVDPKRVAALLSRFETDGLFGDDSLNDPHFAPDSACITVFIKSGKKQVKMQSWHELGEASGRLVGTSRGESPLDGGTRRLEVLRKEPAEFLYFRLVWSETRGKLADLIPGESKPLAGKPVMKAGILSWQEESAGSQPKSSVDPSKK
jgi:hypothetical protein